MGKCACISLTRWQMSILSELAVLTGDNGKIQDCLGSVFWNS